MTAAYPLKWPEGWQRTPDGDRHDSRRFQVTFDRALNDLYADLNRLSAASIVVSSYLPLGRRGEALGGSARTRFDDSGVAVYFFRDEREYVLAQDAFDTPLGNLRSIGLALQGLRQLERHGGAHLAERAFGGFAALPPPEKPVEWRGEFGLTGIQGDDKDFLLLLAETAYKKLAKSAHPDNGGTVERMMRLNKAIEQAREELANA